MTNKLSAEHSPYLKQHKNNPVYWFPWGKEALDEAKEKNKLIIISIGYSACHWCHVMERESFENETIAQTMNQFYISIKVDREERPDIDQLYMVAVQLMTNTGGWPLNVICLPDGRPIYGGTYFKPKDWQIVLLEIAKLWEETPQVAIEYAEKLTKGIKQSAHLPITEPPKEYTLLDIKSIVLPWKEQFDLKNGGDSRSTNGPKFPLPNNWLFLLRYATLTRDQTVFDHVHYTLGKIADGGIYDHIGGGFARYAVDPFWHVPHFEKMLYDNAQLISLYSEAYQSDPSPQYKTIVLETIEWAKREMLGDNGGFYAALDADSEGIEGKFYTFEYNEFDFLGPLADPIKKYYNITTEGNWQEERTNVLFVNENSKNHITDLGYNEEKWLKTLHETKKKLLLYRSDRVRPSLDHKQITAWNALFIKGLIDAYRVFQEDEHLQLALQTASFIEEYCKYQGHLLHQPEDSNRKIFAFLDSYAFTIEAYISIYECTFNETWLLKAKELTNQAISLFYDMEKELFYFSSKDAEELIVRKSEVMDNVIPSSSSTLVRQLYKLGLLFDNSTYTTIANQVFSNVFPHIKSYGSAYSNWAIQLLEYTFGTHEIALTGSKAIAWRKELDHSSYIPNKIILGGKKSSLPLLQNRQDLQSKAYLCINKTCSLPQESITQLIALINKGK